MALSRQAKEDEMKQIILRMKENERKREGGKKKEMSCFG